MRPWTNASNNDLQAYEAISRVFFKYPYLLSNFFDEKKPKLKLPPEKMLMQIQNFSSGERVLIKVALDIWSGSGNATVWELIEVLDRENFFHVLNALVIIKRNRN